MLEIKKIALHLYCVFHGIRFKVNKGWVVAMTTFSFFYDVCNLLSIIDLQHSNLVKNIYCCKTVAISLLEISTLSFISYIIHNEQ